MAVESLRRRDAARYSEGYAALKELMEGGDAPPPHFDSVWVEAHDRRGHGVGWAFIGPQFLRFQNLGAACGRHVSSSALPMHLPVILHRSPH